MSKKKTIKQPDHEGNLEILDDSHDFVVSKIDSNKKKHKKTIKNQSQYDDHGVTQHDKEEGGADSTSNNIEYQLAGIYENKDGTMPDMRKFEKKKRGSFITAFVILLLACLFLGTVAWVGFFVFQPPSSFSQEDVILSISGEEAVGIGSEVRYRIRYRNDQNVGLHKVVLQVRYPSGFVFSGSSMEPSNEHKDTWVVGDLGPQESGFIDVFGNLTGDKGSRQSLRAFLNYTPDNFSSEFQKVANVTVETDDSPFELNIFGPGEVVTDREETFIIKIENKNNLEGVPTGLIIDANNFIINNSNPNFKRTDPYEWVFDNLGASSTVTIRGVFSQSDLLEAELPVKLVGWKDPDTKDGEFIFATSTYKVDILSSDISTRLVINGSNSDFSVQPGELLNVGVSLKNSGESLFEDVSVRLIFDSPSYDKSSILDWASVEDPSDGDIVGDQLDTSRRRGQITWDSSHIPTLDKVNPDEDVFIDITIPIKDTGEYDLSHYPNEPITAWVELRYKVDGEQTVISSQNINLKINSDLSLEVRNDVEKNDLGKDLYIVNWIIGNSLHGLKDLELEAEIFGDITWDESKKNVPAGELNFDPESHKLTWKIDSMPVSVDVLPLQFGVLLNKNNPSQTNLTSKIRFKAYDVVTEEDILKIGDGVLINNSRPEEEA